MQIAKGTLVTKDARRIWKAGTIVSPEWLYERKMCPPSDDEHAAMKKTNVSVFLRSPLRAEHTPATEHAWLSRSMNLLLSVEYNYLDSLNLDFRDQFAERYALVTGETFEVNSRYLRDIEAQLPLPKERLQRAR